MAPAPTPHQVTHHITRHGSSANRGFYGGIIFASQVARDVMSTALKRGQVRGMLQWHLKWFAVTAWVTRNLTTDEILATYARSLWMGRLGRSLAETARRLYGKELGELDDVELALLVGIIKNPDRYDPLRNPRRALERRNVVLQRFVEAGCLPASALPAAQSAPLGVRTPSS